MNYWPVAINRVDAKRLAKGGIEVGEQRKFDVSQKAQVGDRAFVYVTAPVTGIVAVARLKKVTRADGRGWARASVTVEGLLAPCLSRKEMLASGVMKVWNAARRKGFTGMNWNEGPVSEAALTKLAELRPELGPLVSVGPLENAAVSEFERYFPDPRVRRFVLDALARSLDVVDGFSSNSWMLSLRSQPGVLARLSAGPVEVLWVTTSGWIQILVDDAAIRPLLKSRPGVEYKPRIHRSIPTTGLLSVKAGVVGQLYSVFAEAHRSALHAATHNKNSGPRQGGSWRSAFSGDLFELLEAEAGLIAQWPSWAPARTHPRRRSSNGQGRDSDAARNEAIEDHAVKRATAFFSAEGYSVVEVGKPYDLRCKKSSETLFVEVKGTSNKGSVVTLTRNEVDHAREHYPRTALFICAGIDAQRSDDDGAWTTSGGRTRVLRPWSPEAERLRPTAYEYTPPKE